MTTMSEAKPNYYHYVLIAALVGYIFYSQQTKVEPKPDPKPDVVTIEKATAGVLPMTAKGYREAFEDAANQVDAKKFKYARELLEYLKPLTASARETASKTFDVTLGTQIPDEITDHEAEVSALLRRIAKSWK
jgi:4-aminobutyrate aminotransferase-like enzyme